MYTENMLNNDIQSTKRLIDRASSELNALKQMGGAPDWKLDSLQELIDDGMDAIDDLRECRRKHNEAWHLGRGECPTCQQVSDMPGSYCSACQQSAGERMGHCE